ncbi:MAG: phosphotransferase family protein [Actinomycetota bacterium]|nr:phosphotransferase family protein [Actinomycetota bacterium]
MIADAELRDRLAGWLRSRIGGDAGQVELEGLDRVTFGHSAEMMALTVVSTHPGGERRREIVVRMRPAPPALLEPYDLARQFTILEALQNTAVRVPPVLWFEDTGDVLGRPFFVMERVGGTVYEMEAPTEAADQTVARMCQSLAEQLAVIHTVDLEATGLHALDDGAGHLQRELDRWAGEMRRVAKGPLPALERLLAELRATMPAPCPRVTLVHGDAKPGNFAFTDAEVSAVFDWEMTTVGDPLTDIGWLELLWMQPVGITSHPGALAVDDLIAHYESVSGITVQNRPWYRAWNAYKMAVICLVGAMLVEAGHSDDQKLVLAAYGTSMLTAVGLADLGIDDRPDDGPVMPSEERMQHVLNPDPGATVQTS